MQVRRLTALAVVPALAAGGVAACSGDNGSSDSSDGAKKVVSIEVAEPQHLVPPNTNDQSGHQILQALAAGLIEFDKDNKPINLIADSITTPDSKVWTIKMKDGFTFHNGEKVTADSFIDAWNWAAYGPHGAEGNSYFTLVDGYTAMNPSDKNAAAAKTLSGVKKVDDLTLQVTLSSAFADFTLAFGHSSYYPLPKAAFKPDGTISEGFEEAPILNGPFKMKGKWNHDQMIEVERFDGWKGTKPKVNGIKFKVYQTIETAYQDALANKLDIAGPRVSTSDLPNAKSDFGDRFKIFPDSGVEYLGMPTFDPKYSKPEVRRAISMAIDRDQITKTIFQGTQTASRSFASPVVPGVRQDACGVACKYDPAAAKALYQSAGGPSEISITYNGDGGHKEWVEATCNQLQANLGVKCVGKQEAKFSDLLTKLKAKDPGIGMFRIGWGMDYPSLYNYLQPQFATESIPSPNYYGYSNPAFDKLLKDGAAAKTPAEAIKLWQQAEDILFQDMPVIPLRAKTNQAVVTKRVKNVEITAFGDVNPYTVEVG